jgi:hypothetical protein
MLSDNKEYVPTLSPSTGAWNRQNKQLAAHLICAWDSILTFLPSTSSYRRWGMGKIHLPTDSCVLGTCHVTQPIWSGSCNTGTKSTNCSLHLTQHQNYRTCSSLYPIPNMSSYILGTAKHNSQSCKGQH